MSQGASLTIALDQLDTGQDGIIESIGGDDRVAQRVFALGVLPGQRIRIVAVAPMGDPITIECPNGRISLRRAEAAAIRIRTTE